ncbi:hypothetical protein N7535_001964 [Penicillium sp. DV-2018c]|nr:hypothetical protein N7535_001964 [Penicillium sp. DV-2018c]
MSSTSPPPSTSSPPSRLSLIKKANRRRVLTTILSILDRYFSPPFPKSPRFEISIPSKVSINHKAPILPRPVLLTFHGGGFSIGDARDDARWVSTVLKSHPDAVVVSVNYRLAPEHPFPVALDDGVDAILWLWRHADQYNLDKTRFVISGFSAGGNLALALPFRLHVELQRQRWTGLEKIELAGLIAFYPSVDWTRTRAERDATNPIAAKKSMISPSMYRFFDESYLFFAGLPRQRGREGVDMAHPYLSPGLATDALLLAAYPAAVAIYTCGWDQLLVEGNAFRERLEKVIGVGKMGKVGGVVIEDVVHGFDKKPSFLKGNEARRKMYGDAVRQLEGMWEVG